MKNRVIHACVVVGLVVGAVGGGPVPPGHATHCDGPSFLDPKEPSRPQPQDYGFITIDGIDVNVNPSGAAPYLVATTQWYAQIVGIAYCEVGAGPMIDCLSAKAAEIVGSLQPVDLNLRYVYQDGNGGFQIAGSVLAGDAAYILNSCLGVGGE